MRGEGTVPVVLDLVGRPEIDDRRDTKRVPQVSHVGSSQSAQRIAAEHASASEQSTIARHMPAQISKVRRAREFDQLVVTHESLLVEVEAEHSDRIAAHDLVDDVLRQMAHHRFRDFEGVGPGGVGVRVVGFERDVVDANPVQ